MQPPSHIHIKTRIAFVALLSLVILKSQGTATSLLPDPAPKLPFAQAVEIGTKFAATHKRDIQKYYIDRVWVGYIPGEDKECWVISWARPMKDYYFVAIYMDGRAKIPRRGAVYSKDPFVRLHFVELPRSQR